MPEFPAYETGHVGVEFQGDLLQVRPAFENPVRLADVGIHIESRPGEAFFAQGKLGDPGHLENPGRPAPVAVADQVPGAHIVMQPVRLHLAGGVVVGPVAVAGMINQVEQPAVQHGFQQGVQMAAGAVHPTHVFAGDQGRQGAVVEPEQVFHFVRQLPEAATVQMPKLIAGGGQEDQGGRVEPAGG